MSDLITSIPKHSWVLVTGATGYVASHIIRQFLESGYRVRGTVRDVLNVSWIADEAFKSYADIGDFELAEVSDITANHAFDEAVRGVSAVIHVASIAGTDSDPNKVIPKTVAAATSILEAASKEQSVKQFVYTSSCAAAAFPSPKECHVERDTWNDTAVQLAWAPPPHGPIQPFIVYMAGKVAAEKAVWKFNEEKKPHFAVNVVSPGTVIGEPLHKNYVRSTGSWVPLLYEGQTAKLAGLPATLIIDVKDIALLHFAAILDPEVNNERLQVWGRPATWNDVLAVLRKLRPQHQFIPNLPDAPYLGLLTDATQVMALLKKWGNQHDWIPLEDTLADNLVFTSD